MTTKGNSSFLSGLNDLSAIHSALTETLENNNYESKFE